MLCAGLWLSIHDARVLAATSINCGSLVSGTISTAGQIDQYTYAGQAGGMITITLADTGGFAGTAAIAELFDPSGKLVFNYFAANNQQQVMLAMTGDYLIQVAGGGFTGTGTYNLGLACRNPVQPATALGCGGLINGQISARGQIDQYAYAGQAGGMITITLADTGGFAGTAANVQLFDPSGKLIFGYFPANNQRQVTLTLTGTYVIQVAGGGYIGTGNYNLGLACRNPVQPATALACGGLVSGQISVPGQVDQYSYSGQAGGIITSTLADTGGFAGTSAAAELFDPAGTLLFGYFAANNQQQVTLPLTGTYVIQVVGGSFIGTGDYNLGLACRNPIQPSSPLSCGAISGGHISVPGQVDQYAYAGQAGAIVAITLADTDGFAGTAAAAELFDPAGKLVFGYFAANSQRQVTLAMTGTYLIQVVGGGFIGTGNYNVGVSCISGASGEGFVPVTPCRIADTRTGSGFSGSFGPPLIARASSRAFPIPASACGIPNTAQAYSLNVTAVPQGTLGYLSVWPTGELQPLVSTLNSPNGQVVANAAIVPAGSTGSVSVFASDDTDVVLDIDGYFVPTNPAAEAFYPDTPCRIADTRGNGFTGDFGPPSMSGGSTREFPIGLSPCAAADTGAQAWSFNITVVPPGPLGYLSLWPTGQSQPLVSTLNSPAGRVVANAALVPAGSPNGGVNVFVDNDSDVVIDLDGHFGPTGGPGALHLYPVSPCRVADTRPSGAFTGPFGPPSLSGGSTRSFPIPSSFCGIPSIAQAYSLNVTVVPKTTLGYLTAWPTGQAQPFVSTLNSLNGAIVANAALVPAGTGGSISVFVTDNTDVVIDINGYFAP